MNALTCLSRWVSTVDTQKRPWDFNGVYHAKHACSCPFKNLPQSSFKKQVGFHPGARSPEASKCRMVTSGTRCHLSTLWGLHSNALAEKVAALVGVILGKKERENKQGQRECQPLFLLKSLLENLLCGFFLHLLAKRRPHCYAWTNTGRWVGGGMATLSACFLKRPYKFTLPPEFLAPQQPLSEFSHVYIFGDLMSKKWFIMYFILFLHSCDYY